MQFQSQGILYHYKLTTCNIVYIGYSVLKVKNCDFTYNDIYIIIYSMRHFLENAYCKAGGFLTLLLVHQTLSYSICCSSDN